MVTGFFVPNRRKTMNTQIVPIERAADGALIVSSVTIAEGSGVEHRAVLQLVNNNLEDLEQFGTLAFEMRKSGGQPTRIALLNEQQATLVMTYQRNTEQVKAFKFALVKAFFEMAKQLQSPILTGPELMARALMEAADTIKAAEDQVKALTPKAEAFDVFLSTDGDYSINEAAKILSRDDNILTGENRLREKLLEWRWMYRDGRNKPRAMQSQVECGRLVEKAQFHFHPATGEKILDAPQVRVTAKGFTAVRTRLLNESKALTA